MPHKDPSERNAYNRQYREDHKKVIHARVVKANRARRHDRYAKIQALKEASPCADCGLSHPYYVMDFDHRDPSAKKADVSLLVKNGSAWDTVIEEIAKCDIVCANCHRLRTYRGDVSYRTLLFRSQRQALDTLKASTPCLDCAGTFKPCQMDFDHLHSKASNIARLVGSSTEALVTELNKCHLVCANCHRKRGHTNARLETLQGLGDPFRQTLGDAAPQGDQRQVPFPLPHLLGVLPDKELAEQTGLSRAMVAWHRRKAGIVLTRQGERAAA